jgi:hypothetical protein
MVPPRHASVAVLCAAAALCSCTTKLDFDSVSDPSRGDAAVLAADASRASEHDAGQSLETELVSGPDPVRAPAAEPAAGGAKPDTADAASPLITDAAAPLQDSGAAPVSDSGAVSASDGGAVPANDSGAVPSPAGFSCAAVAPAATFCDDFERSNLVETWSWTYVSPETPPAGAIVNDGQAARSGKGSLLAVVNDGVGPADYFAVIANKTFQQFEGKPIHVEVDFDLRVEQIDPGRGRRVMLFQFLFGTLAEGYGQLTLQLESSGLNAHARFIENDTVKPEAPGVVPPTLTVSHALKPVPNVNEWVHVRFTLDAVNPSGPGNHASMVIDDTVLFDGALNYALRRLEPRIELGIPWVDTELITDQDTSKIWRVRYDNVLVRIQPR